MIGMDMGRILTIFNSMKNVNMSGTPAAKDEPVEEEVAEVKAISECHNCNGLGAIDLGWGETVPCRECKASGKIFEYGDGVDSGNIGDSGAEDEGPHGKYGAGLMWQKDEMDIPPEHSFKDLIAGEKFSDQSVNDHDLTVDDQLEQEGLEEGIETPRKWFVSVYDDNTGVWCETPGEVYSVMAKAEDEDKIAAVYDESHEEYLGGLRGADSGFYASFDPDSGLDVNDYLKVYNIMRGWFKESKEAQINENSELCINCGNPTGFKGIKLCADCYKKSYDSAMERSLNSEFRRRKDDEKEENMNETFTHEDDSTPFVIELTFGFDDRAPRYVHLEKNKWSMASDKREATPIAGRTRAVKTLLAVKESDPKLFSTLHLQIVPVYRLSESAPSDQEDWIKANKSRFKKEYGDKKGTEILYATAWRNHNKKKGKVDECDNCAGTPAEQERDSVSVNASFNSDNNEKNVTVTARNASADELMRILKLSGILPGESKAEIAPVPQPAQPVTGLSAVVVNEPTNEAFSEFPPELDDQEAERNSMYCDACGGYHSGNCPDPEERNFETYRMCKQCGQNDAEDETKFCRICHELGYGEDEFQDQFRTPEPDDFEEMNRNEADDYMNESEEEYNSLAGGSTDCEECQRILDPNGNFSPSNVLHGKRYCDSCFNEFESGRSNPKCHLCHENEASTGSKFCTACASGEDMFESKLNEASGYYVEVYLQETPDQKDYLIYNPSKAPYDTLWTTYEKSHATVFDDLAEAKAKAAEYKTEYEGINSIKIVSVSEGLQLVKRIGETAMNEALSPKRENTGLNDAPKTWQNEPNEQMAGWKALIQDTDGLSQPHDMFNPVKGSDNIMTVATKKRETEKPSGNFGANAVDVSAIAERLQRKFNALTEDQDDKGNFKCEECGGWHGATDPCYDPEKPTKKKKKSKKSVKEGALKEDYCISCDKKIPTGSDIDQCKKCYAKDHPEEGNSKKKVTEGVVYCKTCRHGKDSHKEDKLGNVYCKDQKCKCHGKFVSKVNENSNKAVNCCNCGRNGLAQKAEKFSKSHWTKAPYECKNCGHKICTRCKTPKKKVVESTASKVAKQKEEHPEKYCKTKKCLYRTDLDFCPKHRPTKQVSESKLGDVVWNGESNRLLDKVDDFIGKMITKMFISPEYRKLARPMFNTEITSKYLKQWGLSDEQIENVRKCVITAMKSALKEFNISPDRITKDKDLFSVYDFQLRWGFGDDENADRELKMKVGEAAKHKFELLLKRYGHEITESTMKPAKHEEYGRPKGKVSESPDGLYGYICFYNRKRIEVYAKNTLDAQRKVAKELKVPSKKMYMIYVNLAERPDGSQVTHIATESNELEMKSAEITEEVSKSQAKKLQAALDALEQKVKKLGAPPSAKTKITQSMERFTDKIAAIKDALDKRKGESEEKPEGKESEEKSEKKPFEKKSESKKETSDKKEPKEEGKEAEPKPKEQKETASDEPDTNGDDKAPKGKVKDIGKGIYESEVERMQGLRNIITEGIGDE